VGELGKAACDGRWDAGGRTGMLLQPRSGSAYSLARSLDSHPKNFRRAVSTHTAWQDDDDKKQLKKAAKSGGGFWFPIFPLSSPLFPPLGFTPQSLDEMITHPSPPASHHHLCIEIPNRQFFMEFQNRPRCLRRLT